MSGEGEKEPGRAPEAFSKPKGKESNPGCLARTAHTFAVRPSRQPSLDFLKSWNSSHHLLGAELT